MPWQCMAIAQRKTVKIRENSNFLVIYAQKEKAPKKYGGFIFEYLPILLNCHQCFCRIQHLATISPFIVIP